MTEEFSERLISGEHFSGFLTFTSGEKSLRVPGSVYLTSSGKISIRLILEETSRLLAALDPGHILMVDGEKILPQQIPDVCKFESSSNTFTLIQTGRVRRLNRTWGRPVQIEIEPRFSIEGTITQNHWRTPVALRCEIGGLTQWMHSSSVSRSLFLNEESSERDGQDLVSLHTIDFSNSTFKVLNNDADARLEIMSVREPFRNKTNDEIGIRFRTMASSTSSLGSTWTDHIEILRSFQDLVNLLSWHPFHSSNLQGQFSQSAENNSAFWENIGIAPPPPPSQIGPWCRIYNQGFPATSKSPKDGSPPAFILPFSRLGEEEINKWLTLRKEKAHPLDLFLQVINQPQMSPQVTALQLGAGLEALGFTIAKSATSATKANRLRALELFTLVAEPALRLFPDKFADWAINSNEVYQATKHLKRKMPSIPEIAFTNDMSSLVVQIWLASNLGASDEEIHRFAVESPRMNSSYSKLPDPAHLDLSTADDDD